MTPTRRLLAFFAPSLLAAQVDIEIQNGRIVKRTPRIPRPRNGECPVCGTMAKPYHVSKGEEHFNMGATNSRRGDCEYCGCTFCQWAVKQEPKR